MHWNRAEPASAAQSCRVKIKILGHASGQSILNDGSRHPACPIAHGAQPKTEKDAVTKGDQLARKRGNGDNRMKGNQDHGRSETVSIAQHGSTADRVDQPQHQPRAENHDRDEQKTSRADHALHKWNRTRRFLARIDLDGIDHRIALVSHINPRHAFLDEARSTNVNADGNSGRRIREELVVVAYC